MIAKIFTTKKVVELPKGKWHMLCRSCEDDKVTLVQISNCRWHQILKHLDRLYVCNIAEHGHAIIRMAGRLEQHNTEKEL